MTVGALEPQFYRALTEQLSKAGIENIPNQFPEDKEEAKRRMADIFLQKNQKEWQEIFDRTDACVAPVLSLDEAPSHPHNDFRRSFIMNKKGQYDPAPAPRLSRTPAHAKNDVEEPEIGENTEEILKEMGYNSETVRKLLENNVVQHAVRRAKL